MELVWPAERHLDSYVAALQRGWSPDNVRMLLATKEELEAIARDRAAFLASLVDREAKGPPISMLDGSKARRLPGYRRWMWDGEFCGSIGLRWQPGTSELPPHVLGHIGYSVVPWKQNRGYATLALNFTLQEAKAEGLEYVQITTEEDNIASQRVITNNGGVLVERFEKATGYGGGESLRFRIDLR